MSLPLEGPASRLAFILTLVALSMSASGCAHKPQKQVSRDAAALEDGSMADLGFLIASAARSLEPVAGPAAGVTVRSLALTEGFESDFVFQFTISPDDRWLAYFKQFDQQAEPELDARYGKLQLVDLIADQVFSFNLRENQTPGVIFRGDASWAPDSSYCVLDPPWRDGESINKHTALIIDVRDQHRPRVVSGQVTWGSHPTVTAESEEFEVPDRYGCSDCFAHTDDAELMRQHIDPRHLHLDNRAGEENKDGMQTVSPDGNKIYFQERLGSDRDFEEVLLCEFDVARKNTRVLQKHGGGCPFINHMRISPDGNLLAYQLTSEGGFSSHLGLHVLELSTGERRKIAPKAYYAMHWSADSKRLYFYGGHQKEQRRLSVAEFSDGASIVETQPESN
jgi:hypothetical protein